MDFPVFHLDLLNNRVLIALVAVIRSGALLPWEHLAARGGEGTFHNYCAVCHAVSFKLVGPPLTEIAQLYAGKPEGIVAWAKAPGRKRPGFPQMPAFARVLSEAELGQVAGFMLKTGGGEGAK